MLATVRTRLAKLLLFVGISAVLVACGGGGGESEPPEPEPLPQGTWDSPQATWDNISWA